jgi:hypothetical protein
MSGLDETIIQQLKQREEDLEDVGLKSDVPGRFLTTLTTQLEIDLPLRSKSVQAARNFIQSYHTGHSEALQHVRADELLKAVFDDLHASKIELMPVYTKELAMMEAGELDEEDLAMTETLGRRLQGLEGSILKIAEMQINTDHSFEMVKGTANKAKQLEKASENQAIGENISFHEF